MHPQHALVAGAALAAGAHGFMISPNMLDAQSLENKASSEFGLNIAQLMNPEASSRLVKVECPGCAYPVAGKQDVYTMDQENDLIFNFQTTEGGKLLTLNGHPFYPTEKGQVLTAPQAPSDVSFDELRTSFNEVTSTPRRLSTSTSIGEMLAADGADAKLVEIDFRVMTIEEQSISVDGLSLRLLRDEKGFINIVDIAKRPHNGQVAHEAENEPGVGEEMFKIMPIGPDSIKPLHGHKGRPHTICSGPVAFLCRWADKIEDKMNAALHDSFVGRVTKGGPKRPCPGRIGQMAHPKVPVKGGIPKFMAWKYTPDKIKTGHVAQPDAPAGTPREKDASFRRSFLWLSIIFVGISICGLLCNVILHIIFVTAKCGVWPGTMFIRRARNDDADDVEAAENVEDAENAEEKKGLLSSEVNEEDPLPVYSERSE